MSENPNFTFKLPEIATGKKLEEIREKQVLIFLNEKQGYFTLDLAVTKEIEPLGIWNIECMAYSIPEDHMQLINAGEEIYASLMNTNIEGSRLLDWVEIYTKRSQSDLMNVWGGLYRQGTHLGLQQDLVKIMRLSDEKYVKLHGSKQDWSGSLDEYYRRALECRTIMTQRLIEANKPNEKVIAHLGYWPGKTDAIRTLDEIPDMTEGPTQSVLAARSPFLRTASEAKPEQIIQLTLKEGVRYEGFCKRWIDERGFGFIRIDGTNIDVFVHRLQAPWYDYWKGLIEGDRYSFELAPGKQKGKWEGKNVNPL